MDIDGVLADFDSSFLKLLNELNNTNVKLIDPPNCWHWPQKICKFTDHQVNEAWDCIKATPSWWSELAPTKEGKTIIKFLNALSTVGNWDTYYLTNRLPERSKYYTQLWLNKMGMEFPTVILADATGKAKLAKTLNIDLFFDDKPENVNVAKLYNEQMQVYIVDRAFNRVGIDGGIKRTENVGNTLLEVFNAYNL